jgi:hypothetical protein
VPTYINDEQRLAQKYNLKAVDSRLTSSNYAAGAISAKAPAKPAGFSFGNFAGNVISSVPRIAGQAVGGFVEGIKKDFSNVSKGILQSAQMGQTVGALDSRRIASEALMKKYTSDYKAGKINKQQYNKFLKSVQEQSLSNARDASDIAGETVRPEDFSASAARVGLTPFAFGKLGGSGMTGRAAALAEKIPSVAKATPQPFLPGAGQIAKTLAIAPFKKALIVDPNANVGSELVMGAVNRDISKVGAAAGWAALPAGISLATTGAKAFKSAAKSLIFDSAGVFDNIKIKNGKSVIQHLDDIAKSDPEKAKEYEKVLRVAQDNIIKQYKDKKIAADTIAEYIGSKNTQNLSLDQLVRELDDLANSTKTFQKKAASIVKKGGELVDANGRPLTKIDLERVGAVKSTQKEVNSLKKLVRESKSPQEASDNLATWIQQNDRFAQNEQNKRVLEGLMDDLAKGGGWGPLAAEEVGAKLKGTNQLFIKTAKGELKPVLGENGYYMGIRNKSSAQFARSAADTAELERGTRAKFGRVGEVLRKTGMSPESVSREQGKATFKKVKDNFVKSVDDMKIVRESENSKTAITGNKAFRFLEKYAETKKSVTDLRQLRPGEVAEALGVSKQEGKKVLKAYKNAFKGISIEDRSLAGKIQDFNLRVNPVAAPFSRVQAAGRYTYNPFFKLQESIETKAGVAALAGTTARPGKDYQKTINTLRDTEIFSFAGAGSEGADVTFGAITSRLMPNQERTIAAGVEALAEKSGMTVSQFVKKNPDLMQDFKAVVQYPDKGFTSSNMSKMLNLVAFPMRYNIKVATFAAKQLAKQPATVQLGVIKSIKDFNDFAESDAGIKWQSENSELLGILNYFSPTYPLVQVRNMLTGKVKAPGDLGSLGGLPFGVISQVLQNQGVIPQLNRPYINPKTGEVVPEKIPQSLRARASQLLSDVIGQMYNYPGRTIGLESKGNVNRILPNSLMGKTNSSEFTEVNQPLNKEEEKRAAAIKSMSRGQNLTLPQSRNVERVSVPRADVKITPIYKGKKGRGKKGKTRAVPIGRPF